MNPAPPDEPILTVGRENPPKARDPCQMQASITKTDFIVDQLMMNKYE